MKKLLIILIIFLFSASLVIAKPINEITISSDDQKCQKDSDCTGIETSCTEKFCSCGGVPVNKAYEEKYHNIVTECQKDQAVKVCNIICKEIGSPACVNNHCEMIWKEVINQ